MQWSLTLQPQTTLRLSARQYHTRRSNPADGLYSGGFLPLRPGTRAQGSDIGMQSEVLAEYDYDRHLRITAAYDRVAAGRYIQQGPGKQDVHYAALILLYRF
jgi:hypothetical protein